VDVHISWLRGKLSAAGLDVPAIHTVYGVGYRFVIPEEPARLATPANAGVGRSGS
jgi:DNA-binding winged helix-turn-helix (wHTH) protein